MTKNGAHKYIDLSGNTYSEKPEYMTHLRGNILVPKTHGLIALRGKLDSLLAKTMEVQILALEDGHPGTTADLQDVAKLISAVLMGEVTDMPLESFDIVGMDEDQLRKASHNPKKYVGVDHMLPQYTMGKTFSAVNALRAQARETELAATGVFTDSEEGVVQRVDLLRALNRLSSALYIIMCRILAEKNNSGE